MLQIRSGNGGITRRSFLKTGAMGAGLVLAFNLPRRTEAQGASDDAIPPNAFLRVAPDNSVTVISKHIEHGMGIFTGLATVIAEELDASWSQMRAEPAPANVEIYRNLSYGIQVTGGSNSMRNSFMQYREAGATARAMLVSAAAARWGVETSQISVKDGVVRHDPSDRHASFGELAEEAATIPVPKDVPLKDVSSFTLIGRDDGTIKRLDSPRKTNGTAVYGIDFSLPDMLVAVVAHAQLFGSRLRSVDDTAARMVSGVSDVVTIPSGVAVLADTFRAALQGRDVLEIEWDETNAEARSSGDIVAEHRRLLDQPGNIARRDGDPEAALAAAASIVTAD